MTTLAGGGKSLKEAHERVRKLGECLNEKGLAAIRQGRQAVHEMWPQLEARGQAELAGKVEALRELLDSETFFESLPAIRSTGSEVASAYGTLYGAVHAERTGKFQAAIEQVKGRPEWAAVPETMREPVLQPLTVRRCPTLALPAGALVCSGCRAGLGQMESDLAALGGLVAQAVAQVQTLTTPPEVKVMRVRASEFFSGGMETRDQVEVAVARLQDHLLKLLDEGVKVVVE